MDKTKFIKKSCVAIKELENIAKKENFSLSEIAKICKISKGRVSQIFNKVTDFNLSTLLFIADSINYDVEIKFKKRNSKNQTVINFSESETTIKSTEL